jgi:Domain of unknown function (DUF1963)
MHFDYQIALISSGLYAPLALMAFGLILAVGGAVFLWLRRRKKRGSVGVAEEFPETLSDTDDDAHAVEPSPDDVSPPAPRLRRRSLVAGAESDERTPSGELDDGSDDPRSEGDEIEEAQFENYEEQADDADINEGDSVVTGLDDTGLDRASEPDLDPEWIEDAPVDDTMSGPDLDTSDIAALGSLAAAGAITGAEEEAQDNEDAPSLAPLSVEALAAQRRPIVFRQFLPQSEGKDGLSFFGGRPIAPAGFQWPRERGAEGGTPLQFVMQWDCAQLSEQDPTGLIPQDGVLYCFVNFDRDEDEEFLAGHTFIYERGPAQSWGPIETPNDAGPALGKKSAQLMSGCTPQVDNADNFVPHVLPRFPFTPMALDYPVSDGTQREFWSDEAAANALLEVQKSGVAVREAGTDPGNALRDIERPFAAFPHDFGAVRVIASRMIEALTQPDAFLAETLYPSLSADERKAQFAQWVEEAKEIFLLGTQRPSGQKLDQAIADDIWQWFDERKGLLDTKLPALVTESVDLSLSVGSDALSNVPAQWIDKAMGLHALAAEYVEHDSAEPNTRICAGTPARLFGPATHSKGAADSSLDDHLLLLELPSGAGPHHHFDGKVLQYWITADDLAMGQFDAVKSLILEP